MPAWPQEPLAVSSASAVRAPGDRKRARREKKIAEREAARAACGASRILVPHHLDRGRADAADGPALHVLPERLQLRVEIADEILGRVVEALLAPLPQIASYVN